MSERQDWYRRYKPRPENDIRQLLPKSLARGQRFETLDDCRAERDQRIEELRKPKYQNERLAEHLEDCRDEHYQCELTACPVCMRAFRIWRIGEALRVYPPYLPEVWVVTLLHVEDAVPFGSLSDVTSGKIHQRLRKRIERSELNGAVIMGGFEVKADEADQQWIPHSHLVIAGCGEAQLDSLCQQFTAKRASHRVPLTELAKQISYTQKFLSLRQAQPRSGPNRPGGYRLRTRE